MNFRVISTVVFIVVSFEVSRLINFETSKLSSHERTTRFAKGMQRRMRKLSARGVLPNASRRRIGAGAACWGAS